MLQKFRELLNLGLTQDIELTCARGKIVLLRRLAIGRRETREPERNLIPKLVEHVWAIADAKTFQLKRLVDQIRNEPTILHRNELKSQSQRCAVLQNQRLLLAWVIRDLLNEKHYAAPMLLKP